LSLKEKQVNAKRFLPRTARCSRQCGSPVLLQSTTASSMYTHPFTRDGTQCATEDLRFHDRNYFGWLPYAPASIHLASVSYRSLQTLLLNLITSEQQCPKVSSHHSLLATLILQSPKVGDASGGLSGHSDMCLDWKSVRRLLVLHAHTHR
jgi:hypothetical protein